MTGARCAAPICLLSASSIVVHTLSQSRCDVMGAAFGAASTTARTA